MHVAITTHYNLSSGHKTKASPLLYHEKDGMDHSKLKNISLTLKVPATTHQVAKIKIDRTMRERISFVTHRLTINMN